MLSLPVIFSVIFACIGLVISISVGIVVQNDLIYVLWIGFVCMILSAALGFSVYKILEIKVPEFLAILRGDGFSGDESELGDFSEMSSRGADDSDSLQSGETGDISVDTDSAKVFGDHIIVNKVKIKNEPKLIAQAIQTMLSRD